ncbi:TPA: hypothetical protein JG895_002570 [Enterobacter hormaechei subsp. steigerwaltii]|uniref:hypothetical protein n=1 Tax=Enterobacter cloacae complex TaxID=354276 RepID=UPI0022EC3FEB|nr:hypothetical protein [Enterobacter hormaechei]HAV1697934.1 hypothetical protein [Enterobacter hormaechei subsp. steigerwaltii]EHF4940742.1 hypothetical protein [Enterobacter hormaechei]EHF5009847.1 hypothetical protein [Enterobacter hormaechei]ELC6301876.1 hypothetical protein [Enterobacter hormaechei]EMF0896970.1 hypothetical protein [Enterobacter hormaechei]
MKNLKTRVLVDSIYYSPVFCGVLAAFFGYKIFNLPLISTVLYISAFVLALITYCRLEVGVSEKDTMRCKIWPVLAISIIVMIYALSFYDSYMNKYFSFNPIFDVDTHNIWHKDSAYNISIIQSIINFGYPSIGLDGHKLTAYHVLSHYADAFLLTVSGLPIYDSYGFTSYVKAAFLLCSIYIFCYKYSKNVIISSIAFLFVAPFIIASWHAINSHALWLPSFILVLSAGFTFNFLYSAGTPSLKKYSFITAISIILCLGKISTGLAYIAVIFAVSFIRDYKSFKFYAHAGVLLLFIVFYQKFINYSYGIPAILNLQMLSPAEIYQHLLKADIRYEKFFIPCISVIISLRICIKSEFLTRLLFGVSCSFVFILAITQAFTSFNWSDKYYFFQGLYSVVALLLCSYILTWANSAKEEAALKYFTSFMLISFLSFFVYQPAFSVSTINLNSVVSKYRYAKTKLLRTQEKTEGGNMHSLQEYIAQLQRDNRLQRKEMAIFIPKSVVLNQIIKTNDGNANFYTMNIYAATGVQFINGLIGNERAYGLINYKKQSAMRDSVNYNYECSRLGIKAIVIVNDYLENNYSSYLCDSK